MDGVGEWDPDEVTERQHHAEAVLDDVHGGKDGGLHVERVKRVDCLGEGNEDDGVGDAAKVAVLLHDKGDIDDDPSEHTRAELAPRFDVDLTEDGESDTGVELAADEPVIEQVSGAAASGELTRLGVPGVLDIERTNIAESGQEVRDEDVSGDDANKVVGDEGPDREVGAMRDGASSEQSQDEESRVPCWDVLVSTSDRNT